MSAPPPLHRAVPAVAAPVPELPQEGRAEPPPAGEAGSPLPAPPAASPERGPGGGCASPGRGRRGADWPPSALRGFCGAAPLAAAAHKFLLRTGTFPRDDGVTPGGSAPSPPPPPRARQPPPPGKDEALRDFPRFVAVRRGCGGSVERIFLSVSPPFLL